MTNFCGLHANAHGEHRREVDGIVADLLDRIERLGGLGAPHVAIGRNQAQAYDPAAYRISADDLLLSAGVEIMFHALAVGVGMALHSRMSALQTETKPGRRAILGDIFNDCSGDGDLAACTGVPFDAGDSAGQTMSQASQDGTIQILVPQCIRFWTNSCALAWLTPGILR